MTPDSTMTTLLINSKSYKMVVGFNLIRHCRLTAQTLNWHNHFENKKNQKVEIYQYAMYSQT